MRPTAGRLARTLVVAIGNTTFLCGVYVGNRCTRMFRLAHPDFGALPRRVGAHVDRAALCSVVPKLTPKMQRLMRAQWAIEPRVLTAGSAHGLTIGYRRPQELGTDRLAAAVGARARFPGKNLIVVDCGTATTVTALRSDGNLLGGAILPGLSLWPETLATRTAQLPRIQLARPRVALGRSPREGIASGVYFGHCGAIREVVARVRSEAFGRAASIVVGTGGHAALLRREKLFTVLDPELVLSGLLAFSRSDLSHA